MKTILTLVCKADRRKHDCLADRYANKRLLNVDHWIEICMECEYHELQLTQRGKEINDKYKVPEKQDEYLRL